MKLFFRFIADKPWITLLMVVVLAFFAFLGLENFKLDASSDALVLENDDDLKIYREINENYGGSDFLIVTFTPNDGVFSDNSINVLQSLERRIKNFSEVSQVLSLLDAPIFFQPKVGLADIADNIKTIETTGINLDAAKEEILGNPIFSELIISQDGKTTALQIQFHENQEYRQLINQRYQMLDSEASNRNSLTDVNKKISEINERESTSRNLFITELRNILSEYKDQGTLFLGGPSMIAKDMMDYIRSDLVVFGIGVALVFCAILFLFFRNLWFVILPLANAFFTTFFTAGILGIFDWKITVVSSNFIALLLILTISLTVHVLVRFRELSKDSKDNLTAVIETCNQMVVPCFFAAFTTAIAFLSLMLGDIKPVIEFGKMMSVGMIFAFIFTFTLLPALLSLIFNFSKINTSNENFKSAINKLISLATQNTKMNILAFTLMFIALVGGAAYLKVENRFIDYFDESTEIFQGMKLLDEQLGGTATLDIVISEPTGDDVQTEPIGIFDDDIFEDDLFDDEGSEASGYWWNSYTLKKLEEIHDYLDEREEIGKVLSVASGIKLARTINDENDLNDLELALLRSVLPEDIKESLLYSYISKDDSEVRISTRVKETASNLNRNELLNSIKHDLESNFDLAPEDYQISGLAVLYNNMLQSLFSSQISSLSLVFAVIALMFLLIFRSIKIMFVGMAPNLLTAFSVLGMLGLFGIPLDIMTITVAAISVGMAVDNTIHYLFRFIKESSNLNIDDAIGNSHNSVGHAIMYTALTIAGGFSIFVLSNFTPTVLFGLFTALALITSFLSTLIFMPALLKIMHIKGENL
ncbi:MAG: efflux RND transporter permease subunit [Gammaproteobacteria bacterium]